MEKEKHKEHSEETHEHHEHKDESESNINPWMILSIVLAIGLIGVLIYYNYYSTGGASVKGEVAGQKLVDFLNLRTGGGVKMVSAEELGSNLYTVTVSYQGQDIPVFVTKDGSYFVQGAIPIDANATDTYDYNQSEQETEQPQEVPKSDKPVVELFVMTHCPYGTQAEKGYLPAIRALGTSVNASVRFVHYFMHGDKEEKETYNQLCIREEQGAKYLDYLSCFLEASDNTETCLTKVGIDRTKLNACLANDNKKAKEYYEKDKALSQKYGVQGSPTLIVNGVEVSSARDAASLLATICTGFNTPASQCSQKLSTASPSPGFGTASSGTASSDAQC